MRNLLGGLMLVVAVLPPAQGAAQRGPIEPCNANDPGRPTGARHFPAFRWSAGAISNAGTNNVLFLAVDDLTAAEVGPVVVRQWKNL